MKRAIVLSVLLVGCAELIGVRDIPDADGADASDAAPDAPIDDDAPTCPKPTVAITSSQFVDSVSTSNGFVYVQLEQTGVSRCAAGTLCHDPPNLLNVAADQSFMSSTIGSSITYSLQAATTGGSIHVAGLDGTNDKTPLTTSALPSLVATSGARTFFSDDATGDVHCFGCLASDTVWMQALNNPSGLIADANDVYALALDPNGDMAIFTCPFTAACGSQPTTRVQGLDLATDASDIASDGNRLYVADRGQPQVVAIDTVGGQTTIADENAQAIALDATTGDLFYAADDGTIASVKTDGSKTKTALTGCSLGNEIDWLAFDATNVYVLVPTDTTSYVVYAVPRK